MAGPDHVYCCTLTLHIKIDLLLGDALADAIGQVAAVVANVLLVCGTYYQCHILRVATLITIRVVDIYHVPVAVPASEWKVAKLAANLTDKKGHVVAWHNLRRFV